MKVQKNIIWNHGSLQDLQVWINRNILWVMVIIAEQGLHAMLLFRR